MKRFDRPIIKRALVETVTNIGQISHQDRLDLEYAVRKGWLSKGKGGPYPMLKTVYAHPGFNFEASRDVFIAEMMAWHALDVARGVVSK